MIQHESPNQDKEARSKNLFSEEGQLHHFQKGFLSSQKHITVQRSCSEVELEIQNQESSLRKIVLPVQGLSTKGHPAQCVHRGLPDLSLLHGQ